MCTAPAAGDSRERGRTTRAKRRRRVAADMPALLAHALLVHAGLASRSRACRGQLSGHDAGRHRDDPVPEDHDQ